MSQYFKKTIPSLLFITAFIVAKIISFDNLPFDEIKTDDIRYASIYSAELNQEKQVTDISELVEKLVVLEVSAKTYTSIPEDSEQSFTLTIDTKGGETCHIVIGKNFIKTDKYFTTQQQQTEEFIMYAMELLKDDEIITVYSSNGIDYTIKKYTLPHSDVKALLVTYEKDEKSMRVAIGAGHRTSSVYYHDYEWDMYYSRESDKFDLKEFPSDEEIINNMIDFSDDKHLGHYGTKKN